uniref:Uncharacterized protein n=1 Tax=Nelumbo nucifera TaxID=4432 RepID=A0A822XA53_NELNU|nr:TPA_asm: hypothetical protein HUJ06_019797 [Nelumbo nucifera]
MMPDDLQKSVNSLGARSRVVTFTFLIQIQRAMRFFVCGIRLHQISSLSCPAMFNITSYRNATPTAAVNNLEQNWMRLVS